MLVPSHRSLVQISIILIILRVVFCSPQVDLRLDEQTVGDNQGATGDFYLSSIDVDQYPAPDPNFKSITDIIRQSDIQNFLQWIHPRGPPNCDSGLFAFCCNWPAPSPYIGIRRPPNVDPEEIKKRRRKCWEWNRNRPGCLVPENNFCCDCKDVNDVAYNCYNPFYRDDPRFQGKPEPKPSPLSNPTKPNQPAPFYPDLNKSKEHDRDPQNGKSGEDDKVGRRAVVTSATDKIKSTTSTTSSGGGIAKTGADTQLLRAWKRAQPAVADGDDTDENGEEAEIMRAWKRNQPAVADGDDTDGNEEDAEIMRAWKRAPPQVADDGDDPDGTGADVEILRAWKRALPRVADDGDDPDGTGVDVEIMRAWKRAQREVSDGDDSKRAGADAQLLRAWKRAQREDSNGDDTKRAGADAQLLRAWKRVQREDSNGDDTKRAGADAQLLRAWKRTQREDSDGDDTKRAGADAQLLRAWKRAQREDSNGDDTKRAGADAQLLRAWKRAQPVFVDSDNTGGTGAEEDAQQLLMRVWNRAQPEVSAGNTDDAKKIGADAQLFAAWKRSSAWGSENSKSSSAGEGNEGGGEEQYDAGNPRYNDPIMCKKKYLEDLGIFS